MNQDSIPYDLNQPTGLVDMINSSIIEISTLGEATGESTNILLNVTSGISSNSGGGGDYCGPTWAAFGQVYGSAHGFTSLLVCLFGCLMNLLNLIVLTRRGMISPTNGILTGLALADLLNMAEYMPFALFMRVLKRPPMTYGWALFVLVHSNFSQVCHTISIWLTVTLAVWRYIMVAMPLKNKTLCTMDRAKWAVGISYISSLFICVPVYLTFSIKSTFSNKIMTPTPESMIEALNNSSTTDDTFSFTTSEAPDLTNTTTNSTGGDPIYIVYYSALAMAHNRLLVQANFWIYSVVIKIIPCIVLTVVSFRLINSLMEAKRRKEKLMAKNKRPSAAGQGHGHDGDGAGSDRTTRMLLAILMLFLITEFPQGILGLLSGLLGESFFKSCYMPLGDLMDFIALLNSAINFILYCSMSKKFRDTFVEVFHLHRRRSGVANATNNTTNNTLPARDPISTISAIQTTAINTTNSNPERHCC